MALKLYDKLTPSGDFPLVSATDVEMPDGSRLSEFAPGVDEDTAGRIEALEEQDKVFMQAAEQVIGVVAGLSDRVTELEDSGLPKVTTADAGKVLRVNPEGAWAAETIAGAEGVSF